MVRPEKLQTNRAGLVALLEDLVRAGGSDAHLKVPGRPQYRIDGRLVPTLHDPLAPADVFQLAHACLELAREETALATVKDLRLTFGVEKLGRFSAQIWKQRGTFAIAIHRVAIDPPSLAQLGLGLDLGAAMQLGSGLVLVGGARGRHAVLAAMIRHYNAMVEGHLVSLEDPLEYLHKDHRACVSQREVGVDVPTFREGLAAAMRQDPDALVVSDLPEPSDAEMVLRAAEEGLMVVAAMAMPEGRDAVRAFCRKFPAHREDEIQDRLQAVMRGVVFVPRSGSAGFIAMGHDPGATLRSLRLHA
ncbi:MAG: ATPase, T2SS/T4P/T4SS family [Myxococcota bacterium]